MRIFNFEAREYSADFMRDGYVHIPGGVSPDFLTYALAFSDSKVAEEKGGEIEEKRIRGKKRQYLMEFPETSDFPGELYRSVAEVAQLNVDRMMISERHIKIYEDVAPADPPAHKDRLASEVTVGLGLRIPPESWLKLYPDTELTINPFQSTREWRDSLDEPDLPENRLADVEPVRIDMRAGDVVMFAGSSVYHERVNPANTWVLYLKLNAMRLDPLSEDPSTAPQRAASLEILATAGDEALLDRRVEVSPRLDHVSRHYTRNHFAEVLLAYITNEKKFTLSEEELRALLVIGDGTPTIRDVIHRMGHPFQTALEHMPMFRRLGQRGAIDFL